MSERTIINYSRTSHISGSHALLIRIRAVHRLSVIPPDHVTPGKPLHTEDVLQWMLVDSKPELSSSLSHLLLCAMID